MDPEGIAVAADEVQTLVKDTVGTSVEVLVVDPETLARPWAIPGTAGLEHRIGGIEKKDGSGAISYDPANHDHMVRTRAAKVAGIRTAAYAAAVRSSWTKRPGPGGGAPAR